MSDPVRHFLRDKKGEETELKVPVIYGFELVHFFIDDGYMMKSYHKPMELYLGPNLIAVVWQETRREEA